MLLSRAPNLEANKFAMLSVPDTPSTIEEREAFGLFTFLTADRETYFRTAAHFWVCFSKAFCAFQSHLKFLQLFSGGGGSLYLLFGATG